MDRKPKNNGHLLNRNFSATVMLCPVLQSDFWKLLDLHLECYVVLFSNITLNMIPWFVSVVFENGKAMAYSHVSNV